MFLTLEKLVVVAIVAGFILGPQRLQEYTQTLVRTIRTVRDVVQHERLRAEADLGVTLDRTAWESWDLRQYDPRQIVRRALDEPASAGTESGSDGMAELIAEAASVRPGQRYLVTGDAAHPHRIRIDTLPLDDPRRIAAEVPPSVPTSPDSGTNERKMLPERAIRIDHLGGVGRTM